MDIKLDDRWKIKTLDKHNLTLREGNAIRGYYCSIEGAIEAYLDKKLIQMEGSTFEELIQNIKEFRIALNKALEPLKLSVQ